MQIKKRAETDKHLQSAGECFMFLCWTESAMRDLLALSDCSAGLRAKYNCAYKITSYPSGFTRKRLELGRLSFGDLKNQFLARWPEWKENSNVRYAIERVVIYRNGFGHAQIQPFREFLLYTPNKKAVEAIREFMRCSTCLKFLKYCNCERDDMAEPLSLVFHCRDGNFLSQLYGDIKTIDQECFLPTAMDLDVAYQGATWPEDEGFVAVQHHPCVRKQPVERRK